MLIPFLINFCYHTSIIEYEPKLIGDYGHGVKTNEDTEPIVQTPSLVIARKGYVRGNPRSSGGLCAFINELIKLLFLF